MSYVMGIDFGTDSVRSLIVDAGDGSEIAAAVVAYPRWQTGQYCDLSTNRFRQHPQDYIDGLEQSVKDALSKAPAGTAEKIRGLSIDTTGSTPVAVDRSGTPLSLHPAFANNPNAMFILWKDHTAVREAAEINQLCAHYQPNYCKYAGGIYSSEWFWAKILHTLRTDEAVAKAAYSWVEHCDWIPFLLTGGKDIHEMKRSRCAAGHKALWHESFGGLPPNEFFTSLDKRLDGLRQRLYDQTYTADVPAGQLSEEWAKRLGLSQNVVVGVGAFDAHMGAVGGQIQPYYLSKVMGTSTCDMLVVPTTDKLVRGICGQVDGSIIPGMLGMEAGQSAFGDVFAWFRDLLAWPLTEILTDKDEPSRQQIIDQIIPRLSKAAEKIDPRQSGLVALDWFNGRRTPDADQTVRAAITGLTLGSDAARIFRALVEATCFGSRRIVERFQEEGIPVEGIIALGGVAKKSPLVMQIMADVLGRPIRVARSEQTCALGAAMFAATAAGIYSSVESAMEAMGAGFELEYRPRKQEQEMYESLYKQYLQLGDWAEKTNQKIIK